MAAHGGAKNSDRSNGWMSYGSRPARRASPAGSKVITMSPPGMLSCPVPTPTTVRTPKNAYPPTLSAKRASGRLTDQRSAVGGQQLGLTGRGGGFKIDVGEEAHPSGEHPG